MAVHKKMKCYLHRWHMTVIFVFVNVSWYKLSKTLQNDVQNRFHTVPLNMCKWTLMKADSLPQGTNSNRYMLTVYFVLTGATWTNQITTPMGQTKPDNFRTASQCSLYWDCRWILWYVLHPCHWPIRCGTPPRMLFTGEAFLKKILGLATGAPCECLPIQGWLVARGLNRKVFSLGFNGENSIPQIKWLSFLL